jgi:hypothetical protein
MCSRISVSAHQGSKVGFVDLPRSFRRGNQNSHVEPVTIARVVSVRVGPRIETAGTFRNLHLAGASGQRDSAGDEAGNTIRYPQRVHMIVPTVVRSTPLNIGSASST